MGHHPALQSDLATRTTSRLADPSHPQLSGRREGVVPADGEAPGVEEEDEDEPLYE